jgi:hypothetical protein
MSNVDSLNRTFCSKTNRLRSVLNEIQTGFWTFGKNLGKKLLAITLTLVLTLGYPVSALADSADIAADKVDQFAKAYLQVLKLLSDRELELPAAETEAEAYKVEESIEAEAVELITSSGLSLSEYMQILGLASQDVTFRERVLGRMDESLYQFAF